MLFHIELGYIYRLGRLQKLTMRLPGSTSPGLGAMATLHIVRFVDGDEFPRL